MKQLNAELAAAHWIEHVLITKITSLPTSTLTIQYPYSLSHYIFLNFDIDTKQFRLHVKQLEKYFLPIEAASCQLTFEIDNALISDTQWNCSIECFNSNSDKYEVIYSFATKFADSEHSSTTDISAVTLPRATEMEPLHVAAVRQNMEQIGLLTFGIDCKDRILAKDNMGRTPNSMVERLKYLPLVKYFAFLQGDASFKQKSYLYYTFFQKFSILRDQYNSITPKYLKSMQTLAQTKYEIAPTDPFKELLQNIGDQINSICNSYSNKISIIGNDLAIAWIGFVLGGTIFRESVVMLSDELAFANISVQFHYFDENQKHLWYEGANTVIHIVGSEEEIYQVCLVIYLLYLHCRLCRMLKRYALCQRSFIRLPSRIYQVL